MRTRQRCRFVTTQNFNVFASGILSRGLECTPREACGECEVIQRRNLVQQRDRAASVLPLFRGADLLHTVPALHSARLAKPTGQGLWKCIECFGLKRRSPMLWSRQYHMVQNVIIYIYWKYGY